MQTERTCDATDTAIKRLLDRLGDAIYTDGERYLFTSQMPALDGEDYALLQKHRTEILLIVPLRRE